MNGLSFVPTLGKPLPRPTICTDHCHISALVVCLFISDLIQGISGMVTLAWAKSGQVSTGSLCLTQAIMLHIGDVGTAYWNAVIAIHTFWTVVLGETSSRLRLYPFTHDFLFIEYRKKNDDRGHRMLDRRRMVVVFRSQ
jgi:hypothetical protein